LDVGGYQNTEANKTIGVRRFLKNTLEQVGSVVGIPSRMPQTFLIINATMNKCKVLSRHISQFSGKKKGILLMASRQTNN